MELSEANAPEPIGRTTSGERLYENPCPSCGVARANVLRRLGKLCIGCKNKSNAKHGLVGHPLYKLLSQMRARCEIPSASNYKYYGGRGIYVSDEWRSNPAAFVAWATENGYRKGLEIDRKDTDGPYAPWNCQFIPHDKNSRKRSNARCNEQQAAQVRELLAAGETVMAAAQRADVPYMSAWHISKGNTWKVSA